MDSRVVLIDIIQVVVAEAVHPLLFLLLVRQHLVVLVAAALEAMVELTALQEQH